MAAHSIAVVGTRRPTPYGIAATERLSADLARAGLTIVSGMARGIDTAAHRAALKEDGATIAVFGCGVDVALSGRQPKTLRRNLSPRTASLRISDGRARLPSKFPYSKPNRERHFIRCPDRRGRAAQRLGDYRPARQWTRDGKYSRFLAILPRKMSWGPNLSSKQGAKLVQEWTDVTNELPAALVGIL